ncbi:MAG: hypothetical protein ABIE36_00790 [Candidatus Diapherotrites archaeon]
MRLKTIDDKIIEERLSRFEGRHFRLLNRLATKNLKEKISDNSSLRNVNNHLKQYFGSEYSLIKGVNSAIYSKLNGSIKYTRFNEANLGLVIEGNDVNTKYHIKDLESFMKFSGVYNSDIFKKQKIINSGIAGGATINSSDVAYNATINNSHVASGATIKDNSHVAGGAKIKNSYIGEDAKKDSSSKIAYNIKYI